MYISIFSILINFALVIENNAQKLDLFYGFSQDTPSLIRHIRSNIIPSNNSQPYNFTKPLNNQDKNELESVLKILKYKKYGVFIKAGSNIGEFDSTTWQLEQKYNWTGLLIEKNPQNFQNMLKRRKCDMINACLSTSNKVKEEYYDTDLIYKHPYSNKNHMVCLPLSSIIKVMICIIHSENI